MDINICKKCKEYHMSPPAFCGLAYYEQMQTVSILSDKEEYANHLDKSEFNHPEFQIPHDCKYRLEHIVT